MTKKPKPEPDDKEQSQRFVDTVKSLEIDENGSSFERALGIIQSPKPVEAPVHPSEKPASS